MGVAPIERSSWGDERSVGGSIVGAFGATMSVISIRHSDDRRGARNSKGCLHESEKLVDDGHVACRIRPRICICEEPKYERKGRPTRN